jgi:vacuolar-type H+-ATPase subunit B/Vma2
VLVDGDDFNEPVADAARSILDGHVVLTRKLAAAGHFPAIDVLDSKSRVRDQIVAPEHRHAANLLLKCEAAYREKEDLILVGAYQKGSDAMVDAAVALRERRSASSSSAPTRRRPSSSRSARCSTWPGRSAPPAPGVDRGRPAALGTAAGRRAAA